MVAVGIRPEARLGSRLRLKPVHPFTVHASPRYPRRPSDAWIGLPEGYSRTFILYTLLFFCRDVALHNQWLGCVVIFFSFFFPWTHLDWAGQSSEHVLPSIEALSMDELL